MTKYLKVGLAAFLMVSAVAAAGCSGKAGTNPPPSTATADTEDDDATSGVLEHHRYHHHGGVTLFIAMSLDTLGVTPEQRSAVEKIRADLHTAMEPARKAEQNLAATLADEVPTAAFDTTKVDAAIAQVATEATALEGSSANALNALHALLTPSERAALIDKVEAHWAIWQRVNNEAISTTKTDEGRLSMLTRDLDLTADEVTKIRAALGDGKQSVPKLDPQEVTARLRTFGDAFRGETFDANAVNGTSDVNARLVVLGASRMAHFVEAAAPLLTPEQRTKLAKDLREHATHGAIAQGNQ